MKKIEITAEWVLDEFTIYHYADGNGYITIMTDSMSNSLWIDLVLNTLNINYKWDMEDNDPTDDEPLLFEIYYSFKIEEIKDDCPNLYAQWIKMDLIKSAYNRKN